MLRLRILCKIIVAVPLFWGCAAVFPSRLDLPGESKPPEETPKDEKLLPTLDFDVELLKTLKPSNDRDWSPDQAQVATAEINGNQLTIHNMRGITYRTIEDYTVEYYDRTYDLGKLTSVDFIMVPFNDMPELGHTMISFGFEDRDFLGVSVEIRKERGESYGALKGFFRQYELIYVLSNEHDLIQRRVLFDLSDVYLYRTRATPAESRALLLDVIARVNKLSREPEFYDTITNNCTTNIRNHINHLAPDRVPYDYRVLLPGNSDKLAYDLGLLKTDESFEQTKRDARINYLAYLYRDDPDYSIKIRQ
jgi:hypothetical protein